MFQAFTTLLDKKYSFVLYTTLYNDENMFINNFYNNNYIFNAKFDVDFVDLKIFIPSVRDFSESGGVLFAHGFDKRRKNISNVSGSI